jgi:spermidine synthase
VIDLAGAPAVPVTGRWLNEELDAGFSYSILSTRLLTKLRSPYQDVEIHESESFGRLLRLDGSFMASEKDEFFYHESLVHIPACTHTAPRTALIVGGGDGGAAEELLKHHTIEQITLVEIDQVVLDISRQYLRSIHHGVIDASGGDSRLRVRVADGYEYLQRSGDIYDLIVLDLTDPGGPSQPLYSAEFYRLCAKRLAPGGVLSLHIASAFSQSARLTKTLTQLAAVFSIVRPYLVSIPLSGGPWMMACASHTLDPATLSAHRVDERLESRRVVGLQHYNGAVHQACTALPNFIRTAVMPTGARYQ